MTSKFGNWRQIEAYLLQQYFRVAIEHSELNANSNEERQYNMKSLDLTDSKYEFKVDVIACKQQRPFLPAPNPSKGEVCALVPGQALDCGIGPAYATISGYKYTHYLSAKDVLRWSKVSEWLEKHVPQDLWARHWPQPLEGILLSLFKARGESVPFCTLRTHVPDLPKTWFLALESVSAIKMFRILFSILSALYGGIHLTAWNSHFASRIEQLLWRIACFTIMATFPFLEACIRIQIDLGRKVYKEWKSYSKDEVRVELGKSENRYFWYFVIALLFTFYILSRFYIVVEAFISLRHVPIGVYAAVPWVEAIPHV